jgi:aspartate aminotransferase/aminotransferase
MLSERIKRIEESGIRKIFHLAVNNKGEYTNLSIGQPHFPASDSLKKAAKQAIDNNFNSYLPTAGLPSLQEKIVKKLERENQIKAIPDEIIITTGTSGGIFLALSSILDEGDEVILPDPYFVLYKEVLSFLGAKIVYHDTYPDFHLDANALEKLITPKTRVIIINSPNNPTGAVYSKEELGRIAEIAKKHDLIILSDEIYEKFDYDNKFTSIGGFYNKTITLNGFSKSHSITGWRLGYAHGPREIIAAMNKLQQYTYVCAPSVAQAAIDNDFDVDIEKELKAYKAKRDYAYDKLKDKYELNSPEGAFYAFIKAPNGQTNFVDKLIEKKLLVVPGQVFSHRGNYFRISFAATDETLERGVEILLDTVK